jgi:hypothetical protein
MHAMEEGGVTHRAVALCSHTNVSPVVCCRLGSVFVDLSRYRIERNAWASRVCVMVVVEVVVVAVVVVVVCVCVWRGGGGGVG